MSANCNGIVMFYLYGQFAINKKFAILNLQYLWSRSRIPDAWSIKLKF